MTDAVTPPATTIELPLTPSANFASICAQLLELMSAGAPGSRLAGFLQRAIALLRKGEIALVSDNGIVRTNDTDLAARTAHTWHTVMTQHGVKRVTFAADATTRELLQFLALLVASPSTPSRSFTDLWRELGAWRIHAQVAADGSEASLATPTNAQPPLVDDDGDALFRLCREVLTGAPVGENTALGNALRAAGEKATEALLLLLAESTSGSQRRMLYEAILEINDGHAHLVTALGHPLWFVARNAASLLGELRVESADEALCTLLAHEDSRVRLAAVTALGELATPVALRALHVAVGDAYPRVREAAWQAWSHIAEGPALAALDTGLRSEPDAGVQRALLDCAVAHADIDVNAALVRFCARKCADESDPDLLIYAVELLAKRKPHAALPFTRRLANDRPVPIARSHSVAAHG